MIINPFARYDNSIDQLIIMSVVLTAIVKLSSIYNAIKVIKYNK